jgi:hypothetical protein
MPAPHSASDTRWGKREYLPMTPLPAILRQD